MKFLSRLLLSLSLVVTAVMAAGADEKYFFRYGAGTTGVSHQQPQQPEEPGSPGDFDVLARFFGVVGEEFSSFVPTRPGEAAASHWSVVKGAVPEGLELDAATGEMAGVPLEAVDLRVLDVRGYGASGQMGALARVEIEIVEPRDGSVRQEIYGHTGKTLFAAVKMPPSTQVYEWTPVQPLPEWASLLHGFVRGVPPEAGTWPLALSGRDHFGQEVAFAHGQIVIEDGPQIGPVADRIQHRDRQFVVRGQVQRRLGDLRWELEGDLPRNLRFERDTGTIRGFIPSYGTSATFRLKAVDINGAYGWSNPFTLGTLPADVSLRNVTTRYMTVNRETSFGFAAEEMVGVQEWAVAEGELPDGLSIDPATGRISGTPSAAGTWPGVVVEVSTDLSGADRSNPFSIVVNPDMLTASAAHTHVRQGTAFATPAPQPRGGTGPYAYMLQEGGALPDAVEFDPDTGVLSGVMMATGNQSVAMNLTDSTGREGTPFVVGVTGYGELSASMPPLLEAVRLTAFSAAPSVPDYTVIPTAAWSLSGGQLPAGLSLDAATGTVGGTPEETGHFGPYVLTVTDGTGEAASTGPFHVEVTEFPDMLVAASSREVPRGVAQNVRLASAVNPIGEPRFELAEGSLPDGLRLTEDGRLAGSSLATGTFEGLVIRATDEEGRTAESAAFALTMVQPGAAVARDVAFRWAQGVPFAAPAPQLANAVGAVAWEAASGLDGLALDPVEGTLSGTIGEAGNYGPYLLGATDAMGRTAEAAVTLEILPPLEASLPASIPASRLAELAAVRPSVANAVGRAAYSLSGTLPDGTAFDASSGAISGTPLEEGAFPVTVTVTDAAGQSRSLQTELQVGPRLELELSYSPSQLYVGLGSGLPVLPRAANAAGTVTYAIAGDLPPGLRFNQATGAIHGTPAEPGEYAGVTVTATDTEGMAATAGPLSFSVTLAGQVEVADPVLRAARAGSYFLSAPVPVHNVLAPLAFAAAGGGALPDPDGVVLFGSTGELSGVPSATGLRNYLVSVTDALSRSRMFSMHLDVVGDLAVSMADVEARRGSPVTAAAEAANAVGAKQFSLSGGSLPTGLSLNAATGSVAGVPVSEGVFGPYAIAVTDATGDHAVSQPFTVNVGPREALEVSYAMPPMFVGSSIGTRLPSVRNAMGAVSFSVQGTLPPGIQFSADTGAFSGTPTEAGTWGGRGRLRGRRRRQRRRPRRAPVRRQPARPDVGGPDGHQNRARRRGVRYRTGPRR